MELTYKNTIFTDFIAATCLVMVLLTVQNVYLAVFGSDQQQQVEYIISNSAALLFLGGLWLAHRRRPTLARHIFVFQFVIGANFLIPFDDIDRAFVAMTLPVMMAAFLIRPIFSVVYAAIVIGVYCLNVYYIGGLTPLSAEFNIIGVIALLIIAAVAWVISYYLERALAEVSALNRELDSRVQARTRDLAQTLERERIILHSITDGVVAFNETGQVITANPAASRLTGLQQWTDLAAFLAAIRDEKAAGHIRQRIEGGTDEGGNIQVDWGVSTALATVARLSFSQGRGHVIALRDFTKEAALERAKNVFLGMVSHELRTPMAAIKGYIDLVLKTEQERVSADGLEYLRVVQQNIRQLLGLANDLIDLSRMETGDFALYPAWIEPLAVVQQAVDTIRPDFEKHSLSLTLLPPAGAIPAIYADSKRFYQIALNLLSNACKYTATGGATVTVEAAGGQVVVAVADTGVGIRAEDQARLFERFFRANDRQVQQAGGTGLGLNITRRLVELQGGQLTFESEYGRGTTFTVTFPIEAG